MNTKSIGAAAALLAALSLTACTGAVTSSSPSNTSSGDAAPAASPSFAEPPASAEPVGNLAFGDAITYEDGVSLSVSAPAAYAPTQYAAGADQAANVAFTFTITNGSSANLEPSSYATVSSGGVEASSIFDENTGSSPSTVILPGGTVSWTQAFSVADPASIILQVAPSFLYDDAVFTNAQ